MRQWMDQSRGRTVPVIIGISVAATLTMGGAAVLSGPGPRPAYADGASAAPSAGSSATPSPTSTAAPLAAAPTGTPPGPTPRRVTAPQPTAATPAPATAAAVPLLVLPDNTTAAGPLPPVTHPQDDSLGSTICSHEQCAPPRAADASTLDRGARSSAAGSPSSTPSASASPKTSAPATTALPQPSLTGRPAPSAGPTKRPITRPTHTTAPPTTAPAAPVLQAVGPAPEGVDVSSYQGAVDWPAAFHRGARFAYVKATENTRYRNPYFAQQYNGARQAGLVRGAYHFALPDRSSGAVQAGYFVSNGGGWSADGVTLPPMLDIEYNPYGRTCYGLNPGQMTRWIAEFSATVRARTGRAPIVYTTRNWWNTCTGSSSFGATNPLFVACYCNGPGVMPNGWRHQTIWQYDDNGALPGDQDLFHGSYADLRRFALGL